MEINSERINAAKKQIKSLQKQIVYDTRDYPISYIVSKFSNGSYFIPTYQRNKVWTDHQKERFIESLLLGYPIPLIFLSEQPDGKLEIVDGVQRITTLVDFLHMAIRLTNMDKLNSLKGFKFNDLPISEQRKLEDKSLRIIVLGSNTELSTRIDLFNRLNTSAEKANDAEVRSGVLSQNRFQIFIEKLSQSTQFSEIVKMSTKKNIRKESTELVSRFFAYSNNYKNFKHSVKDFITDYIVVVGSSWNDQTKKKLQHEFDNTFDFAERYFAEGFLQNDRNQTPRVRFESLMSGINLALQEEPNLVVTKEDTNNLLKSEDFIKLTTSDASNSRPKVVSRIEYVRDFLLEAGRKND
ncbi:DUF262 domain-containing protein [Lactiplantibacillus plantarum]|uniref:GmrSD restriction endonuclease domain-containing protein n=1 Tax=Lactiplantibacillus plantarum TaxID=1590 RepID=UPI001BACE0F7|nr:DUF262 domain-containing protein [Lactiplantibacillus plantarum]MBS0951665.1 DUF262 domain-containing protein [Lactiplantibacillus plantarum]MDN7040376.1 DUF262 domain-containing protein [Lactiplantibacillus plantarum]